MERELITVKRRGETAGCPLLFGTTPIFFKSLGLKSAGDLPKLKELYKLIGDHLDLILFGNSHATE